MQEKFQRLRELLGEVDDLHKAAEVLAWDQQTYMPPGGVEARSAQLATLKKFAHNRFVSDEIGQLLEDLRPWMVTMDYGSDEASLVRVTAREYEKARKIPANLVAEIARNTALAQTIWVQAREEQHFAKFKAILSGLVALTRTKAEILGYTEHIYDPLLDIYEPGMKTAEVASIFEQLKTELIPLFHAISEHQNLNQEMALQGTFDIKKQWDFGIEVLKRIGYDFQRGRQDTSPHPFTTSFSPDDVRITTRLNPQMLTTGLLGSIHEGGHALYDQGCPKSLVRTMLCEGASMGMHESQSRFWENVIGRSHAFWGYFLPRLKALYLDQLSNVTVEQIYRALNIVCPSYIRVDADELTYNFHIFLRFELETALIAGEIEVKDLPELWNEKMRAYLGITPPNDALGVLQDIHWSAGLFGYFPTYALGNVLSLQFYDCLTQDLPDVQTQIVRGEFVPILKWLRAHIHIHGAKFTTPEIVQRVAGETINPQPYIHYLKTKYGELYML